jgi:hypothetical protein
MVTVAKLNTKLNKPIEINSLPAFPDSSHFGFNSGSRLHKTPA